MMTTARLGVQMVGCGALLLVWIMWEIHLSGGPEMFVDRTPHHKIMLFNAAIVGAVGLLFVGALSFAFGGS